MTVTRFPLVLFRCLLLAALLSTPGCENFAPPHQAWTEARVEGRVVDAETGQPVHDATVSRVRGQEIGDAYAVEKGAKAMQKRPAVTTTAMDGSFILEAERTAYLFMESYPSFAVTLKVQHRGYDTLQQLFTNVVFGPRGQAPVVPVGDLKIFPAR